MSGFWARTLVYLGLREEPEDHVEWDVLEAAEPGEVTPAAPGPRGSATRGPATRVPPSSPDVRPVAPAPAQPSAPVRSLRGVPDEAGAERVAVVQLVTFEDVEAAASAHREDRPVLLDVSGATAPADRRAIDFLSGVVYASGGTLRRLTRGGFLLLPRGAALGPAERERLARLGYPVDGGAR
jgi:cell division inhibitor SepF